MKEISKVITLGSSIIGIVLLFTFIGYKLDKIALFIIVGFVLAILYMFKEVFRK